MKNQENPGAIKCLYGFFLIPFIVNYIIGDKSSSHIITETFSVRNYTEIFLFFVLAIYLLIKKNYIFDNFIKHEMLRPFYFISALYIVSTIWSEYKLITFFRALEFFIVSLVALIALNSQVNPDSSHSTNSDNIILIKKFVIHITIMGFLSGFLHKASYSENIIGWHFGRDNLFSNILGGGFIVYTYLYFIKKTKSLYLLIAPILFSISFSLSSLLNMIVGLTYLYLSFNFKKLKYIFVIIILLIAIFHFFFTQIDLINTMLGLISSRSLESISNLTGREHIWTLILSELKNYKLGSGFATDLFILKEQFMFNFIKTISSAHNIYIEAFVAAKWLGLFCVIYAYYFWFVKAPIYFNLNESNLKQALILFAVLCGFTNSGFGGSVISHPYIYFWVIFAGSLKTIDKKEN